MPEKAAWTTHPGTRAGGRTDGRRRRPAAAVMIASAPAMAAATEMATPTKMVRWLLKLFSGREAITMSRALASTETVATAKAVNFDLFIFDRVTMV